MWPFVYIKLTCCFLHRRLFRQCDRLKSRAKVENASLFLHVVHTNGHQPKGKIARQNASYGILVWWLSPPSYLFILSNHSVRVSFPVQSFRFLPTKCVEIKTPWITGLQSSRQCMQVDPNRNFWTCSGWVGPASPADKINMAGLLAQ